MNDKSKVATAVLAGLALGAAAWYLLGTDNGKKTTGKWADSLKSVGDSIKDLRDKAADTIDQLAGHADKLASKADQFASKAKTEAKTYQG